MTTLNALQSRNECCDPDRKQEEDDEWAGGRHAAREKAGRREDKGDATQVANEWTATSTPLSLPGTHGRGDNCTIRNSREVPSGSA